jgi:hypothetical protein
MVAPYLVVVAYSAAVMTAAWLFFDRTPPWRPWIGVMNTSDVAVLLGVVVATPYLFRLPEWGTTALLSVVVALTGYRIVKKIGRSRVLAATVGAAVVAAEIGAAAIAADRSNALLLVNGAVLAAVIVGAASSIVKCGIQARDVAVLAGVLAVYDVVASSQLTLIDDLMVRASGRPFVPLFGWWHGSEHLVIGAADLLVAAMFPLAARKAFGKTAGLVALVTSLAAIACVLALVHENVVRAWPPMVVLGPFVVAQYFWWVRRRGHERAMWEYLSREPRVRRFHDLERHPDQTLAPKAVGGR